MKAENHLDILAETPEASDHDRLWRLLKTS